MHDWSSDLLAVPSREYPEFKVDAVLLGRSASRPRGVVTLLEQRAMHLEVAITESHAVRELVQKKGLPRLFWIEGEFATALRKPSWRCHPARTRHNDGNAGRRRLVATDLPGRRSPLGEAGAVGLAIG